MARNKGFSPKKQVVHYVPMEGDHVEIGQGGFVQNVLNHPSSLVTNRHPVYTSEVVKIFKDGFETLNTRYKVVKEGEVERQPKYDGYGATNFSLKLK